MKDELKKLVRQYDMDVQAEAKRMAKENEDKPESERQSIETINRIITRLFRSRWLEILEVHDYPSMPETPPCDNHEAPEVPPRLSDNSSEEKSLGSE